MAMSDDDMDDLWHIRKLDYLRDKAHNQLVKQDPSHPKSEFADDWGDWNSEDCPVCNPHVEKSDNLSKQQFTSPRSK